jgi:hypothetical protein
MEDEIIGFVYKTKNYDAFKFLSGNRNVDHSMAIEKSMREFGSLVSVVIVNEKLEIIEGQNRFTAAKRSGEPFYYTIVEGYGIKETRILNQCSKNWSAKDFIKSYAEEGKVGYVKLQELHDMFPELTLANIVMIAKGNLGNNSGYGSDNYLSKSGRLNRKVNTLKRGEFEVKDVAKTIATCRMIMAYKDLDDNKNPIFKRTEFISAIIKLVRYGVFNEDINAEIIRKIKMYPSKFFRCVSNDDYARMLEAIYNYKKTRTIRLI